MTKQKTLLLIPLIIVAGLLIYCWTVIAFTELLPTWRHYVGLLLLVLVVFLYFRNLSQATVGLGIYLLFATFNLLAITPAITTSWINIDSSGLHTPPVQLLSLGLLILYFVLNLDSLINIQLDFKEAKARSNE